MDTVEVKENNMPIRHGILTINTTRSEVLVDDIDMVQYSMTMSIQNIDETGVIYLGDSTVTAEDYGYALVPGDSFTLDDVGRRPGLYAISDVNGTQAAVIRISQ